MKTLDRVLWAEGMFLAPQHLQQNDRYHEGLLSAHMIAAGRPELGVMECELDTAALALGQVSIIRFSGVLPDGSPVAFDQTRSKDGDDPPDARPIESNFASTQRTLEVFIGLKREHQSASNVEPEDASPNNARKNRYRYSISRRRLLDMISARAEEIEVAYARKNLTILFGNEPRDDYDAIKVAEIERGASGTLRLVETYIPPCFIIRASPYIMSALDELLALMTAKQRGLSSERHQREATSGIEFQARDVTRFLQLHTLNAYLPVLRHLTSQERWPTESAYMLLLQLAGQLATFDGKVDPTTLPDYQYDDLGGSFGALFDQLRELLQVTVRSRALPVELEDHNGKLVGRLDEDTIGCEQYVLSVRSSGMSAEQTAKQLPLVAKIAALGDIDAIMRSATPGVKLSVTSSPPAGVTIRPETVYFTLSNQDRQWNAVLRDRALAIYLPRPFNSAQANIELLAIPSSK
jgi:type VI secretion system protein ImpJ